MNTHLNGADQTVILLTQTMGELEPGLQVLSIEELAELENHIVEKGFDLGYIITPSGQDAFSDLPNADQINRLLARSLVAGMRIKQWGDEGVSVICRTNMKYPPRVLQALGQSAPPIIYCIGPSHYISNAQLSIDIPYESSSNLPRYTTQLGQGLQKLGAVTVTGGDTQPEKALLTQAASPTSTAIGIVRTGLLKASKEKAALQAIAKDRLVLASTRNPEYDDIPNTHDHSMTRALIHSLTGRTMVVNEGPPISWKWSEEQPEPNPEAATPTYNPTPIPTRPR